MLKIADGEVLGEQEHFGRRGGEAGEVVLLQISGGECAGTRRRTSGSTLPTLSRSRAGGAATLWRAEREWGRLPGRAEGGIVAAPGDEQAGKTDLGEVWAAMRGRSRAIGDDADSV